MEKIIFITNQPEKDDKIIELLRILLPDCEININSPNGEACAYSREKRTG